MKAKQQSADKEDETYVDYFIDNEDEEGKTVIDDLNLATERFISSFLFAINCCREQAITDPSSITTTEYWQRHKEYRDEFKQADADTKLLWSLRSRHHLHQQPQIARCILREFDKDPKRSWMELEYDIVH